MTPADDIKALTAELDRLTGQLDAAEKHNAVLAKSRDELKISLDNAINDYRQLKAHAEDLGSQVEELRKGKPITQGELADIARIRAERDAAIAEQDKIALWLRDNKREEIAAGRHAGLGLAEVCIMYMAGKRRWPWN